MSGEDLVLVICILVFLLAFLISFIACAIAIHNKKKQRKALRNYIEINIGMPENEMLEIMGGKYNKSSLKNNRAKYEWRINATSTGINSNGVSTRSYSGVSKVDIYTWNGYVEEIKPYNVK